MSRILVCSFLTLLLAVPAIAGESGAPVVAVLDIHDRGVGMSLPARARLLRHLTGAVAATGKFKVVPRERVRKKLSVRKRRSDRRCRGEACRRRVGIALGAARVLSVQISKIDGQCVATATLYNLTGAKGKRNLAEIGSCSAEPLKRLLEDLVTRLSAKKGAAEMLKTGGMARLNPPKKRQASSLKNMAGGLGKSAPGKQKARSPERPPGPKAKERQKK